MTTAEQHATPKRVIAELREISRTYFRADGTPLVKALKNVSLNFYQGQYTAIMGASGSGKSTMMNLLGCLDQPTSGAYLLDGVDVARMSDEDLSRYRGQKIGFVFQAFHLISELTVAENVALPLFYQKVSRAERMERARHTLDRVGLGDRTEHRPNQLSGGQQQRVAIARSLINDPAILMADEPTGNLDSTTGTQILEMLDELHNSGMTIIMVTHDERISERCERVLRLADGELVSDERGGRAANHAVGSSSAG